jgi:hypothetical protein
MTQWKQTPKPPKSKAELREMLAEAVRNTQPQQPATKRAIHNLRGSAQSKSKEFAARTETLRR